MFELYLLADMYLEWNLRGRCKRAIHRGLTVENVIRLWTKATESYCEVMERICFGFVMNNLKTVLQSTSPTTTCLELIISSITVDNVITLLRKAHKADIVNIQEACLDFIFSNFDDKQIRAKSFNITRTLRVENVIRLWTKSIAIDSEDMEKICFSFVMNNLKAVLQTAPTTTTCTELIIISISMDNAIPLLRKAYKADILNIQEACLDFIF